MNRRERTQILVDGSPQLAKELASEIEASYAVNVIEQPNNGLVMLKMRENAKRSLFYLGEVIVVEAKVEINGHLGLGIVIGTNENLAYYLAVIDAAYNAALPETAWWAKKLQTERQHINENIKFRTSKILKTKVSFETMDE
ncbi:phosphonate C-P lyase system protein PhnG [Dendrosporobacter sp. 1207_IL3150]|uniref:phosphonate C-P lyase system protein PhnG n=1 Tax=Dendrosporobacter sp. 1207_IL3150 TaxID=3084054 RepID=UPI002FDB2DED